MLERDHINFFTKNDLEKLISKESKKFEIKEAKPINLYSLLSVIGLSIWLKLPKLLSRPYIIDYMPYSII